MSRLRHRDDGPPPQGNDRRPWVWDPPRRGWDPEYGEVQIGNGRWKRQPADPEDPPALIDD